MDMSRHPSIADDVGTSRARIVTALNQRAQAAAAPETAAANLPALITALPGDASRAPQTEFDLTRQVLFLENLSITGSVRSAASAAQVSHQSAYRARRATGAFRTAWDAALVVARANADAVLASRAIDGVTEEVRYHGEVVGTRTRYSDRLLLAHLGRLDKLAVDARIDAFADDFDAALARFGAGEEAVMPEPAPTPEKSSPGPCNTRSMSNTPECSDDDEKWADEDLENEYWHDGIDLEDDAAVKAELDRIDAAMEADRPADAPQLTGKGPDGKDRDPHGLIEDAQHQAFVQGVPRWWLVLPPAPFGGKCRWHYADEQTAGGNGSGEDDSDNAASRMEDAVAGDDADAMMAEARPESASEPSLNRTVTPWPRQPWNGIPIDDGRCQPFHGRGY